MRMCIKNHMNLHAMHMQTHVCLLHAARLDGQVWFDRSSKFFCHIRWPLIPGENAKVRAIAALDLYLMIMMLYVVYTHNHLIYLYTKDSSYI